MRVFKPQYKRNGQTRQLSRWHVTFKDHRSVFRRVVAFTDESQSKRLGDKLQSLAATLINDDNTVAGTLHF